MKRLKLATVLLGGTTAVLFVVPSAASAAPTEPYTRHAAPVVSKPAPRHTVKATSIRVKSGDTLSGIATRLHLSWPALAAYNHLADPNVIVPGQELKLPPPGWEAPPMPVVISHFSRSSPPTETTVRTISNPVQVSSSGWSGPWACIAGGESGGNPAENTGNGYYGGLQFSMSTWVANGGTGNPAAASISEQEAVANTVVARSGGSYSAWPNTSRACGL